MEMKLDCDLQTHDLQALVVQARLGWWKCGANMDDPLEHAQ
jgi:hypothetical protein